MTTDARVNASPDQMVAAKELIQAFLYSMDTQPGERTFNYAILLRVEALLLGKAPPASIREDQIIEALDAAELVHRQRGAAI